MNNVSSVASPNLTYVKRVWRIATNRFRDDKTIYLNGLKACSIWIKDLLKQNHWATTISLDQLREQEFANIASVLRQKGIEQIQFSLKSNALPKKPLPHFGAKVDSKKFSLLNSIITRGIRAVIREIATRDLGEQRWEGMISGSEAFISGPKLFLDTDEELERAKRAPASIHSGTIFADCYFEITAKGNTVYAHLNLCVGS